MLEEKIKINMLCSITFFWKLCHLWDNVEKCGRAGQVPDDNIIGCMCFACWVTMATNTCWEYVMLITPPWQQWSHEHTSVVCCTYIACLVKISLILFTYLCPDLPSDLFPSGFPIKTISAFLFSPIHATSPTWLLLLAFIAPLIFGWGVKIMKLFIMQFSPSSDSVRLRLEKSFRI